MIPVDELVYDFHLTMNKLGREDNKSLLIENVVIFLNQAQISWIKNKIGQNNLYRAGYESVRKRIDDLQKLKVENKSLTVKKLTDTPYPTYVTSLTNIPDYMFYITSSSLAKKNECEDIVSNNLIRTGELKTYFYNDNHKPNFAWRETLTTIGNDNLSIYTDEFEILKVYLTYLRYPTKIDKTGYIGFDGSQSTDQDCELPYYAKQDVVDLAVKFASQATENFPMSQAAEDRLNKNSE